MSYYSGRSRSPYRRDSRSISRSRSEDSTAVENPGNNLYVTGLSPRITNRELEKHFSTQGGKVTCVHLVVDPWSRESRVFGFVTMSTVKEADRCLKYLDGSVLEGCVITVEKARRRRGRTPTPGRYLGLKTIHGRRRSPSYSPYERGSGSSSGYSSEEDRDRSYSPHYRDRYPSRSRSRYSRSVHRRERSYTPYDRSHSRHRRSVSDNWSDSPYYARHDRSYSPRRRGRGRYYSPCYKERDRSYSPYYRERDSSYSPYYRGRDRSWSPYYRGRDRDRSWSPYYRGRDRSGLPYYRGRDRCWSPYDTRKFDRKSVSPRVRSGSRRSYSPSPSWS